MPSFEIGHNELEKRNIRNVSVVDNKFGNKNSSFGRVDRSTSDKLQITTNQSEISDFKYWPSFFPVLYIEHNRM